MSPHRSAWWGVVATTVVSAWAILAGLVFAMATNGQNGGMHAAAWFLFVAKWGGIATIVAAITGMLSATVCAPLIRLIPRRETLPLLGLVTVIAGVVGAVVFVLAAFLVVPVVQVMTCFVLSIVSKPDPRLVAMEAPNPTLCLGCGYSLAGLDRKVVARCPECGEPVSLTSSSSAASPRRC